MTAPFRVCIRCQLDSIRPRSQRLFRQPIGRIRQQCAIVQLQPVQSRSYTASSDTVQNPSPEDGQPIAETARQSASQTDPALPENTSVTENDPGVPVRRILGKKPSLGNKLPKVKYGGVATGYGKTKPWSFPMEPIYLKRIGELSEKDIGTEIIVKGWIVSTRILGAKLIFGTLMHEGNQLQITYHENALLKDPDVLMNLQPHTPIEVRGFLARKATVSLENKEKGPKPGVNLQSPFLNTVEISINDIQILGPSPTKPVIQNTVYEPEERYLTIRTDMKLLEGLKLRSKVSQVCRKHLTSEGFLEIETPLLFKSTPEGAREFLVPTRRHGHAYALPQSPQQYKQILMAGGIAKYFQLAKCFRDEDLRADRQPEFTQLDMEMGFAGGPDVIRTVERLLKRIWCEVKDVRLPLFPKLSYHNAMISYGSDKPDMRYDLKLQRVDKIIAFHAYPGGRKEQNFAFEMLSTPEVTMSNSKFSKIWEEVAKPDTQFDGVDPRVENPSLGMVYYNKNNRLRFRAMLSKLVPNLGENPNLADDIEKDLLEKGLLNENTVVILARRLSQFNMGGSTPIGQARIRLAKSLIHHSLMAPLSGYKFVWIHSFPLFTKTELDPDEPGQSGAAGYKATHHPFTAPMRIHEQLLFTNPWRTVGQHYDIVCNGVELGGGSTRIHDPEVQMTVLKDILKVPEARLQEFDHLFKMLGSGCPPHAGLALGFDRMVAMLHETDSIRDVIAFPKNNNGVDAVVGSPGLVSDKQLEVYGLSKSSEDTDEAKIAKIEAKPATKLFSNDTNALIADRSPITKSNLSHRLKNLIQSLNNTSPSQLSMPEGQAQDSADSQAQTTDSGNLEYSSPLPKVEQNYEEESPIDVSAEVKTGTVEVLEEKPAKE